MRLKAHSNNDYEQRKMRWRARSGVPARAAGGIARAAALSDNERKEIAKKAAKARWTKRVPQATHQGIVRFGEIEIEITILESGQQAITQRSFMVALGRSRTAQRRHDHRSQANLPAFLTEQNLKPFIGERLAVVARQIEFRTRQGVRVIGYAADFLFEACNVLARAQGAGVLKATQRDIAERARIIAKGLQRHDMTRLIGQATGYEVTSISYEVVAGESTTFSGKRSY
ncbi:UNVERIFIED_ORG: hypothetical protein M2193_001801 [Bradyrhizobium japonicum]|uniref:hypothetical protein n=1 Tax=Bradyrhizobium TaxID=374 RepID=UPI00346D39D2